MRVDGGTLISDGILSDGILSVSMTYYSDCARTACSSRVPLLDEKVTSRPGRERGL